MILKANHSKGKQLADYLKKEIIAGKLSPGDRMASARELAEQFSVSTQVAMSAFDLLEQEKLIQREPKKGIFIKGRPSCEISLKALLDLNILSENSWLKIIKKFEKENSGMKINPLFIRSYVDYEHHVKTFQPDVFSVYDSIWHTLRQKKLLHDISHRMGEISGMYRPLIKLYSHEGKTYALPFRFTTLAFFCNKNIFNESKVKFPDNFWSWRDFFEAAKKLGKKGKNGYWDYYAYGMSSTVTSLFSFIRQNGGEAFGPGMKPHFNKKAVRDAVKFWMEEILSSQLSPLLFEEENPLDLFMREKVAMTIGKYDLARELNKNASFSWAPIPLPAAVKKASTLSASGIALNKNTSSFEASWRLASYIVSHKTQEAFAQEGWGLPSVSSIAEKLNSSTVFIDALAYAEPTWPFPDFEPIKIIREEISMVLSNLQSAETACDRITERCNQLRKKMKL